VAFIGLVTEQAVAFQENLKIMAINEFTSFATTLEDDAFVPPDDDDEFNLKLDLLSDKDILV